jgi:hypothetical protein
LESNNTFAIPKPTKSELLVRKILRANNIHPKYGQIIWYTEYDKYTPDLIIGKKLIVEVDGKVHEIKYQQNKDRIRERALKNIGYTVFRVKNEEVQEKPALVAQRIIDKYMEIAGDDEQEITKITKLKKPLHYKPITREIDENLPIWANSFNKELNDGNWSVDFFKESLSRVHPSLIQNKSAMEKIILILYGLNLRKMKNGALDFEFSFNFLKKSIRILNDLFGKDSNVDIHIKNLLNTSAPGFFKNLIFKGGPNGNEGIVSIKDKDTLNSHIDNFNKYFSELGISVDPAEIIQECKATLRWFPQKDKMKYNWLIEWINTN